MPVVAQRAHTISTSQFDAVALGTSQAQVISSLGKQPEDTQRFVSKGIFTSQDLNSSCASTTTAAELKASSAIGSSSAS